MNIRISIVSYSYSALFDSSPPSSLPSPVPLQYTDMRYYWNDIFPCVQMPTICPVTPPQFLSSRLPHFFLGPPGQPARGQGPTNRIIYSPHLLFSSGPCLESLSSPRLHIPPVYNKANCGWTSRVTRLARLPYHVLCRGRPMLPTNSLTLQI